MEKLISIIGLTSSGKSDLGIKLALEFNGEIVSADSRQVYKGLDYCSGKVTKEEMNIVPHHLIDVENLGNQFSLYDFQKLAYEKIDDIISRNKVPFLVGGTGLYSRSVVEGYCLSEAKINSSLRKNLEGLSQEELLNLCKEKNITVQGETTNRRLIRLLEKIDFEKQENKPKYDVLQIGINFEREQIYKRIKIRLEKRMSNMIEEIKTLLKNGTDAEFLKSLGLEAKFVVKYLAGEFANYDEFFEELYKEERHFAKRQQTWFNKEKNLVWINGDENLFENAKQIVKEFLEK